MPYHGICPKGLERSESGINSQGRKDYRLISLSSFLLKTLERLQDLYLRIKLIPQAFSGAQRAYLKGRSVETALHRSVGTIEGSLQRKEFALSAFLDVEGAFNNVRIESTSAALVKINLHPRITRWLSNMLGCLDLYTCQTP